VQQLVLMLQCLGNMMMFDCYCACCVSCVLPSGSATVASAGTYEHSQSWRLLLLLLLLSGV
jgi:hypothetical protein